MYGHKFSNSTRICLKRWLYSSRDQFSSNKFYRNGPQFLFSLGDIETCLDEALGVAYGFRNFTARRIIGHFLRLCERSFERWFSLRCDPRQVPALPVIPVKCRRMCRHSILESHTSVAALFSTSWVFSSEGEENRSPENLHPRPPRFEVPISLESENLVQRLCGRRETSKGSRFLPVCIR